MEKIDVAELLYRAADAIRYQEIIASLPDCSSCGKRPRCLYVPRAGAPTRINCPLWSKYATAPSYHGRLIDADDLLAKHTRTQFYGDCGEYSFDYVSVDDIIQAPTIALFKERT